MLQAFYSATVGAQQQMLRMDVQGNNIANINTHGYKSQVAAFSDLMYSMVEGAEGAQLPRGSGMRMISTVTDFSSGDVMETGGAQDYAIAGEGFFALFEPETGQVTLTRDGAFAVGAFRELGMDGTYEQVYYLTDGEGRQVLGQDGFPIRVTDLNAEYDVGVFNLQYRDGLLHQESGRFVMTDKNGLVNMSDSQVLHGFLESSNADLATEMSKVIEAQRAYSYVMRMITTADEVETTINGLTG